VAKAACCWLRLWPSPRLSVASVEGRKFRLAGPSMTARRRLLATARDDFGVAT